MKGPAISTVECRENACPPAYAQLPLPLHSSESLLRKRWQQNTECWRAAGQTLPIYLMSTRGSCFWKVGVLYLAWSPHPCLPWKNPYDSGCNLGHRVSFKNHWVFWNVKLFVQAHLVFGQHLGPTGLQLLERGFSGPVSSRGGEAEIHPLIWFHSVDISCRQR